MPIQARADADFQHPAGSTANDTLPVRQRLLLAHGQMGQPGKQVSRVEAHP
jgi:hypothetical protein